MGNYLSYQDGIFKTICRIFKNKDGKTLHLLPVTHYGELQYYNALLNYIGNKICIYEGIMHELDNEAEDTSEQRYEEPKSLDERIALLDELTKKIYMESKKEIRWYLRQILKGDLRKLRNLVKRNLKKLDKRVAKVFHHCERTAFRIFNISTLHNLISEALGLEYQYNAINYATDIAVRKNWIHADMKIDPIYVSQDSEKDAASRSKLKDDDKSIENIKRYDSYDLDNVRENALMMYRLLYTAEYLLFIELSKRREMTAQNLVTLERDPKLIEDSIPTHFLESRNKIVLDKSFRLLDEKDEIIIFYGAIHMPEFEKVAIEKGYFLHSTTEFTVFNSNVIEE